MAATMTSFVAARNLTPRRQRQVVSSSPRIARPIVQQQQEAEVAILCEDCNGIGWLLCYFCEGQKTNVKSETNRIYRRCPSCSAVLYSKCKAFKCVTFPNHNDGEEVSI